MAVEPQVQQFIDFIRDEMPRRIKTNPNSLPDAQKLLVSVSGTLEVIYKTLAELDIAIKSDVDTELSNKEPTIEAGTSSQYWRGDKTWQTLNTGAVAESTNLRYLNDAEKARVTSAADTSTDGYLTSTDWNTFNSKQAALVSGTNIKTINGTSVLGSGDLVVGEQSVVLLEQDGSQTLSVGKRHYLPRLTIPYTLNLNAPTGAAIGDWFILESRYSASLDGIGLSAFLLGINLKMAAGEYVIGHGDIVSPDAIPLLNARNNSTNSPNFTNGCSFRFTKVTATSWALQPIYGAVMPERFQMKVSGTNYGGTFFVSTAVAGTYATVTLPTKDANLDDLPSVAATNSNTISSTAVRCSILGGQSNNVSGTDNVLINCTGAVLSTPTSTTMIDSKWSIVGAPANVIAIGVKNYHLSTQPLSNTVVIGSANNADLSTYPVAAATMANSLFASTDGVPVSGTLYATADGSQTLSLANCLPIPVSSGTAQYEVDFIVSVGAVGFASTACNATGCISMRRIFTVFKNNSGAAVISAVDTVGTDRTLGAIGGTFTPTIALSGTTHVTVGITRAGGVAGQEAMAISARVRSHLTR